MFHIIWKYTLEKIEHVWGAAECAKYLMNERLIVRLNTRWLTKLQIRALLRPAQI